MSEFKKSEDRLRTLNFDAAFPDTPDSVHDAMRDAGARIRRRESALRRRRQAALAAAAVLVVALGVATAVRQLQPARQDEVAAPKVVAEYENSTLTEVFSSKEDACYHRDPDCAEIVGDAVGLPLITARAFDKLPCPKCGSMR